MKASVTTRNFKDAPAKKFTETESLVKADATDNIGCSLFDTNVELPKVSYVYKQTSLKGEGRVRTLCCVVLLIHVYCCRSCGPKHLSLQDLINTASL